MDFKQLREEHPQFIYESYHLKKEGGNLRLEFVFKLEPNIYFKPHLLIPYEGDLKLDDLNNFVFHLGLIEAISYWKCACSPAFVIKAGSLTDEQIDWWQNLLLNGLGEFFYQNGIKPNSNLVKITSDSLVAYGTVSSNNPRGDLILVSGGKDSAVTLELLKNLKTNKTVLLVNPTQAALDNAQTAGYPNQLQIQRDIDPKLLELNRQDYLNGHTPFSALLAFLGVTIGFLNKHENVVVFNENSAGEENLIIDGKKINHQYSKSFDFEQSFRDYLQRYLTNNVHYFSFLRPLYDLQVSKIFSRFSKYYKLFKSCNVDQKTNSWCGSCAKCAFVFLALFPFLDEQKELEIFDDNYFEKENLRDIFYMLVGLRDHKPFECVGTYDESTLAVALSLEKYKKSGKPVPQLLVDLEKDLNLNYQKINELKKKILEGWDENNFLPLPYQELLKKEL